MALHLSDTQTHKGASATPVCDFSRGSPAVLSAEQSQALTRFMVDKYLSQYMSGVSVIPLHTYQFKTLSTIKLWSTLLKGVKFLLDTAFVCVCVCVCPSVSIYAVAFTNEYLLITRSIKRGSDCAWTRFDFEWFLRAWLCCKTCSSYSEWLKSSLIGCH